MGNARNWWICLCYLAIGSLAFAADLPAGTQQLNGTFVNADGTSIRVRPSGARPRLGSVIADREIPLGVGRVTVTKSEIGFEGVKSVPISISQLQPGDPLSVTIQDGKVVRINVHTPPAVNGLVVGVGEASVTVRVTVPAAVSLTADEILALDPQHTAVTLSKLQFGPTRKVALSSLHIGQSIMVLAKDHLAYVIHILPTLPVEGVVRQVGADRIVLAVPAGRGTTRPAERTFAIDPKETEVFQAYFGQALEPAKMADLAVGMSVGVTFEAGLATAITIPHAAVYGTLIDIQPGAIMIELNHDPKVKVIPKQTFAMDGQTKILLGKETGQSKLPDGKTRRYFIYNPGANAGDLRIGQSVSVTAKDNRVLTMRVTPLPPGNASTRP